MMRCFHSAMLMAAATLAALPSAEAGWVNIFGMDRFEAVASGDGLSVEMGGTASSTQIPTDVIVEQLSATEIHIQLSNYAEFGSPVLTPWETTVDLGNLPADHYDFFVSAWIGTPGLPLTIGPVLVLSTLGEIPEPTAGVLAVLAFCCWMMIGIRH